MLWIIFALGAALSWGLYGPALHNGQVQLGNPMRALLCVGVAYFLIGVLVPLVSLSSQGNLNGFTMKGSIAATLGGTLGAAGAVCIIFAFKNGGLPTYVMPLVFAGAFWSMYLLRCGSIHKKNSESVAHGICAAAGGAGRCVVFQAIVVMKEDIDGRHAIVPTVP